MSIAEAPARPVTIEEFLALDVDDGIHRELIEGEVRAFGMTYRSADHSEVEAIFTTELTNWSRSRPEPRGKISCGEVGFRLAGTKETLVGIDVAYTAPGTPRTQIGKRVIYDAPPIVAVEVLSASDTHADIADLVALYLKHGVVAWVADPRHRTVGVHRPGELPFTLNESQELVGDPYLPGFRVPFARLFE